MPVEAILVLTLVAAYVVVFVTALLFHGIWVAPFIERHGARTAGFVSHWIIGTGLFRDYLIARRICKERGLRPSWLRWFSVALLVVGILMLGVFGFIVAVFVLA